MLGAQFTREHDGVILALPLCELRVQASTVREPGGGGGGGGGGSARGGGGRVVHAPQERVGVLIVHDFRATCRKLLRVMATSHASIWKRAQE